MRKIKNLTVEQKFKKAIEIFTTGELLRDVFETQFDELKAKEFENVFEFFESLNFAHKKHNDDIVDWELGFENLARDLLKMAQFLGKVKYCEKYDLDGWQ